MSGLDTRVKAPGRAALDGLDHYDYAFLTGGALRVVQTALLALHESDAIRIQNPVAGNALWKLNSYFGPDARFEEAQALAGSPTVYEQTRVVVGSGRPANAIEAEVARAVLKSGTIDILALESLPTVAAIPERHLLLGVRRPMSRRYEALGFTLRFGWSILWLWIAFGTLTVIALASNNAVGALLGAMVVATGGLGAYAVLRFLDDLKDAADPLPPQTALYIWRRKAGLGVTGTPLHNLVGQGTGALTGPTSSAVAMVGGIAVWVADPVLAASLGPLADPTSQLTIFRDAWAEAGAVGWHMSYGDTWGGGADGGGGYGGGGDGGGDSGGDGGGG